MDISNPIDVKQTTIVTTFIDSVMHKAAAKGEIDPFNAYIQPLDLLRTPTQNTILHIHITYRTPSKRFLGEILTKCPLLLLQTNIRGETPLHMAARHGHDSIVKFLIDSAKGRHEDIEAGAGAARAMLRMANLQGETALHKATRHNRTSMVQVMIEEDPDFTYSANKDGETPLYLAAERGFQEIVVQILNTCASPAYHGPNDRTALHEAVIRNDSEMITKLLEKKKNLVKDVDQQGWTPLHHASHFGHLSAVKQLLESDRSVAYVGDKHGKIPLHLAAASGHKRVLYYILEYCPDSHELVDAKGRNVIHFAIQSENSSMVNNIFKDTDQDYFPSLANLINEKDINGNTPLHLAATYCVNSSILIKHPLVDKMAVNNTNFTPLDVILANGSEHSSGNKGGTERSMKKGGYKKSHRNVIKETDRLLEAIDMEETERVKNAHMVVAALVVTVTFAAGFTIPGGYNSEEGSAILSSNGAFKTFIITDAMAFLMSTCALFFYFTWGADSLSKRRMGQFMNAAAFLIMLAIIFMLIAFAAGVYVVLPDSSNIGAAVCIIISIFVLICYAPLKVMFTP